MHSLTHSLMMDPLPPFSESDSPVPQDVFFFDGVASSSSHGEMTHSNASAADLPPFSISVRLLCCSCWRFLFFWGEGGGIFCFKGKNVWLIASHVRSCWLDPDLRRLKGVSSLSSPSFEFPKEFVFTSSAGVFSFLFGFVLLYRHTWHFVSPRLVS